MFYGILLSILTCFFWGSTSVLLRGVNTLNVSEMTMLRSVGGFCAASVIAYFTHASLFTLNAGDMVAFAALVLFNNLLGDAFLFLALHKLGVARASSIASTYPVVVAIFSFLFFDEAATFTVVTGTLSVVAGVACLCKKEEERAETKAVSISGLVFAVVAAVFWSAGLLFNKYLLSRGVGPGNIVLGRGVTFLVMATSVWALENLYKEKPSWTGIFKRESVLAVTAGTLSLGIGAFTYSCALEHIPASVATPIGASNPLLATALALFIFKEKVRCIQWLGILLAVSGSILVTL